MNYSLLVLLGLCFCALCLPCNGQSHNLQSSWVIPAPQGNTLRQPYFIDSLNGILLGDFRSILKTKNGGQSWYQVPIQSKVLLEPSIYYDRYDPIHIHFKNPREGIVLTINQHLFVTEDGGETWEHRRPKEFASSNQTALFSVVESLNDTTIVAFSTSATFRSTDGGRTWSRDDRLGTKAPQVILPAGEGAFVAVADVIYRSTDNGKTWIEVEDLEQGGIKHGYINTVGSGFLAGRFGSAYTTDGGVTWGSSDKYLETVHDPAIYHVLPVNDSVSLVAGALNSTSTNPYRLLVRTTDAGKTWTAVDGVPNTFFFAGTRSPGGRIFLAGTDGIIIRSDDHGVTWQTDTVNPLLTFRSMRFSSSLKGVAIGDYGMIAITKDGGETWRELLPYRYRQLNSIAFATQKRGVAVGNDTTIIHTVDGGQTWLTQANIRWKDDPPSYTDFKEVLFYDSLHGYIVANGAGERIKTLLLRTVDGGEEWEEFTNIPGYDGRDLLIVNDSIFFLVGEQPGDWRTTDGFILRSTDRGVTWEEIVDSLKPPAPLNAIGMFDLKYGMAVGEERLIMYTKDSGTIWSKVDHVPNGPNFAYNDLQMIYADVAYAAYDLGAVLIRGNGYKVQIPHRSHPLYGLHAISDSNAMFVGDLGTLLTTLDRGQTWDSVGRVTLSTLYDVTYTPGGKWFAVGEGGSVLCIEPDTVLTDTTTTDTTTSVSAFAHNEELNIAVSTIVNGETVLFHVEGVKSGAASLRIFSIQGELIATPYVGEVSSESFYCTWHTSLIPSGTYLYELTITNSLRKPIVKAGKIVFSR